MMTHKNGRKIVGTIAEIVVHLVEGMDPATPPILLGPVVWARRTNGSKRWYFIVGGAGLEGFRSDQLNGDGRESTVEVRELG